MCKNCDYIYKTNMGKSYDEWEDVGYVSDYDEDDVFAIEPSGDFNFYLNKFGELKSKASYDDIKKKETSLAALKKQYQPPPPPPVKKPLVKANQQFMHKFPFKPAEIKTLVTKNEMSAMVGVTVSVGGLKQHAEFSAEVLNQATAEDTLLELLCKGFTQIIEVRPDVFWALEKLVQEAKKKEYELKYGNKGLTPYAKGGKVKGGSVGRRKEVDLLPGLSAMVKNPVTGAMNSLENTIITLNDVQMWTREQIADWLETLDVDIKFKTADSETPVKKNKYDF